MELAHAPPRRLSRSARARRDARGFFSRTFDAEVAREAGVDPDAVRAGQHVSLAYGVIRGLHVRTGAGRGRSWCAARTAGSTTSWSTCGPARRRTARGELRPRRGPAELGLHPARLRPRLPGADRDRRTRRTASTGARPVRGPDHRLRTTPSWRSGGRCPPGATSENDRGRRRLGARPIDCADPSRARHVSCDDPTTGGAVPSTRPDRHPHLPRAPGRPDHRGRGRSHRLARRLGPRALPTRPRLGPGPAARRATSSPG